MGDDQRKQERLFDLWTTYIHTSIKPNFPFVRSSRPCWHLIQSTRASVCPDKMNMITTGQRQSTIQNKQHIWSYTSWLGHVPNIFLQIAFCGMEHKISSSSPWKPSKNAVACFPKRFICATLSSFSSLLGPFGYFLSLIYESRCPSPSMRWRDLLVDKKRREFWSRILSMLTDRNTVKCLRKKVSSRFLHHCTMCSL